MNINRIILTSLIWAWSSAEAPTFFVKRHYKGDLFETNQNQDCSLNLCSLSGRQAVQVPWKNCQCQCLPLTPTFRQDTGQCVDNLDECQLAPFQSPAASENIPLVSIPNSGNYVHPSAEILLGIANHFKDVVCHVLLERFLGPSGWLPLANLSITGPIFQLVHNSKTIFLQFVGDEHESSMLNGQLIMVEFACKTKTNANIVPHPCAAFRVAGKPSKVGAKDVLIAAESSMGRWRNWLTIGLGAGLLGVTYMLAILVYLVVRKRHDKKTSSANSQLWIVTDDRFSRVERKALSSTPASNGSTSPDCKDFDAKYHPGVSCSGALQNSHCEEVQSGPSRLLSQLRCAWNAATMKLRGRTLTFSPSLVNIAEESALSCRSVKSSEPETETTIRCHSPETVGSGDSSWHSGSDGIPESALQRSKRNRKQFADGSTRIAIAQKLPEPKKKKQRNRSSFTQITGGQDSDGAAGGWIESSADACDGHRRSLADSLRRKAASCENITALTIGDTSELGERRTWSSGGQQTFLLASQAKATDHRKLGTPRENLGIGRSKSTCSIDCKRKSVSFDLRNTVISRELGVKGEESAPTTGSGIPIPKMTSFATLRLQSRSSEFLHLKDHVPHKSDGTGTVQTFLENGGTQLAPILKRSQSNGPQGEVTPGPTGVIRSQSVLVHTAHQGGRSGTLERIRVKVLVDSFNRKTSGLVPLTIGTGQSLENKRIWQVVNDDSGYHSSDSDNSTKNSGNGRRTLMDSSSTRSVPYQ